MMRTFPLKSGLATLAVAMFLGPGWAQASVPSDPFNYSRKDAYVYDPSSGRLATTTFEPDQGLLCSFEQRGYDAYGNVNTVVRSPCAVTSARATFMSRTSTLTYGAQAAQTLTVDGTSVNVAAPAGIFATLNQNALNQSTATLTDPRFGLPTQVTDPNGAVSRVSYDDFGRKVRESALDGTAVVHSHCFLQGVATAYTASNTSDCPDGSAQAPASAMRFIHSEPRNTAGAKMGPFTRIYFDAGGREVRRLTESYDSATQPVAKRSAMVAQDTVYNEAGLVALTTTQYFLQSGSTATNGTLDVSVVATQYDVLGRAVAVRETRPGGLETFAFGAAGSFGYGAYGSRAAIITRNQYSGLKLTTTDPDGRVTIIEKSALGQTVRATDPLGAQVAHVYNAFGNLVQTTDPLQNSILAQFDLRGRQVRLIDPDRGLLTFCVDALGQVKAQQSSKMRGSHVEAACPNQSDIGTTATAVAEWSTFAFDRLGRLTNAVSPSVSKSYVYDSGLGAIGRLSQTSLSTGITKNSYYDAVGRKLSSRTDVVSGPSWAESVSYDTLTGRVTGIVYPTGLKLVPTYTALGYEASVITATALTITPMPAVPGGAAGSPVTWPATTVLASIQRRDAAGRTESSAFANGLSTARNYDLAGRPVELNVGTVAEPTGVVRLTYGWSPIGILDTRTDHLGDGSGGAVSEYFVHDELKRLIEYRVAGPGVPALQRIVTMSYNAVGMLQTKSDVGVYLYGPQGAGQTRPHAPIQVGANALGYDLNGNLTSATGGKYRTLSFNEFDRVTSVQDAGTISYSWWYDELNERIKETRIASGVTRTTWYAGILEREINSASDETLNRNRHSLRLGKVVFGTFISSGPLPTLAPTASAPPVAGTMAGVRMEFQHQDMLQSVVATTDHAGVVTARMAYDPFGARRHTGGDLDAAGSLVIDWSAGLNHGTGNGFTGHEELDDVGLVNANARLYDDRAGIFIQVDPVIQAPDNTQNYGRYSYVFNNPLVLVDPSGMMAFGGGFDPENKCWEEEAVCKFLHRLEARLRHAFGAEKAKNDKEANKSAGKSVDQALADGEMKGGGAKAAKGEVAGSGLRIASWEEIRPRIDPTMDPMVQAAGVGLASLTAVTWGSVTGNEALVQAGFDGARDLRLSTGEGLSMAMSLGMGGRQPKAGVPGPEFVPSEAVTGPYVRPSGAGPTAAQRASVQGKPCVDCGALTSRQVADHIEPLVVQHYRTGSVNVSQQRSLEAVQPHCPSCSAAQGGQLGIFSRLMKDWFGF